MVSASRRLLCSGQLHLSLEHCCLHGVREMVKKKIITCFWPTFLSSSSSSSSRSWLATQLSPGVCDVCCDLSGQCATELSDAEKYREETGKLAQVGKAGCGLPTKNVHQIQQWHNNPMLLCKIVIIYASDITVHSRCIEFRYSSAIEYNTHILMCLHALHIVTNIDI